LGVLEGGELFYGWKSKSRGGPNHGFTRAPNKNRGTSRLSERKKSEMKGTVFKKCVKLG